MQPQTIPGIRPRTAQALVAFTGRVDWLGQSKQFASYFGMTPAQDASALRDRHGHIGRRGPSVVCRVLPGFAAPAIFSTHCVEDDPALPRSASRRRAGLDIRPGPWRSLDFRSPR